MPSFLLISLGCPKNLIDSETMTGRLCEAGFELVDGITLGSEPPCDLALLNTCGFLASAREEARLHLKELIGWKKRKRVRRIIVTGCMVRHEGKDDQAGKLAVEFPEVDAWIGVFDEASVAETARALLKKTDPASPLVLLKEEMRLLLDDRLRRPLTAPHVAYLKIADGCNRLCSFCAIPSIRGRFVSKPLEIVIEEAERLAAAGVKELVLIAQETTFYGSDLYGKPRPADLLERLEKVEGIRWIRLMYTYPLFFGEEMIERFSTGSKLLPYIDMPLQHANDVILKRMRRSVNRRAMETLLARLRDRIEHLVLRTSLIVGFPGETEPMFEELLAFVRQWKFERAGIFPFSAEEGTAAATLDGRVSRRVLERRYTKLLEVQEDIAKKFAKSRKGRMVEVLIDGLATEGGPGDPSFYLGRTYAEAPDVDPQVFITGTVDVGSIVRCEIVQARGSDLLAVPSDF